ncbi:MAG TPA: hypothetical protein VHY37_09825 [Tepidisphaeraceae bacterium]|jgi:hypothetical protein|nr:hypothetical protein [Tepidisphaeraceae bacterium]
MPAEHAPLTDCAAKAAVLARKLRADQAQLDRSPEGAELVSAAAECLEKIAALAESPPAIPPIISESSPSSA